jgi:autoinducer 2-degrading protein
MAKVVLVVELEIQPENLESFVDIVSKHGSNSLKIEEGCLRFEVLKPRESTNKVILVEMYSNDAALDLHWNSDHMAAYRERVSDMIVSRVANRCDLL